MFILVTYDVNITSESGARRLRRVARACQDYGHRVQNSVFECVVNESQLLTLKHKIDGIIDKQADSVRFYNLGSNYERRIDTLGKNTSIDFTGNLII